MDRNVPNDADLVASTLAGDREAFGQLYDRHARVVCAVVASVSGDWSAIEDMVQECFLRAYRNLARLRDPQSFAPWIVGVARQVARERRRSLRRDRHEFGTGPSDIQAPTDVEAEVHDRDQLELVMQRLAELPERERLAIQAFFLEQEGVCDAAERLGLSRSGFYSLVRRAVARLAAQVQGTKQRT